MRSEDLEFTGFNEIARSDDVSEQPVTMDQIDQVPLPPMQDEFCPFERQYSLAGRLLEVKISEPMLANRSGNQVNTLQPHAG